MQAAITFKYLLNHVTHTSSNLHKPPFEVGVMDGWVNHFTRSSFLVRLLIKRSQWYKWIVILMHIDQPISELYFKDLLFMKCLQKPCRKSSSLLFPVNLEMSLSVGCWESYGVSWQRRPRVDRHIFRAHGLMTELLHLGKWTDWNANFHKMIKCSMKLPVRSSLARRLCVIALFY